MTVAIEPYTGQRGESGRSRPQAPRLARDHLLCATMFGRGSDTGLQFIKPTLFSRLGQKIWRKERVEPRGYLPSVESAPFGLGIAGGASLTDSNRHPRF